MMLSPDATADLADSLWAGVQSGRQLALGTTCVLSLMPGWHPQAVHILCEQQLSLSLTDLLFVTSITQQILVFIQLLTKTEKSNGKAGRIQLTFSKA